MWTNWPFEERWDPAPLEENWAFIQDVRPLVKRYGPPETRIDLMNEAAISSYPSGLTARLDAYIVDMHRRYVRDYGAGDVSWSVISKDRLQGGDRLGHLVDVLRAADLPLPNWIDLHPTYGSQALAELRAEEATMLAAGWKPKIAIGESGYERGDVARAVAEFARTSSLTVDEIDEWPLRVEDCTQPGAAVSAPYRADAYFAALTGSPPPSTLGATVEQSGRTTLSTPYGRPVTALTSGTWRVRVHDGSARAGFHLWGPGVDRRTSARFRGSMIWNVTLRRGVYRYGGARPIRVLSTG